MIVPITPQSKPRITHQSIWSDSAKKYYKYSNDLKKLYPYDLPSSLIISFHMPMAPSWSKKKRAELVGRPCQQRPDIDNLVKAVMDALCDDDSYIYHVDAGKFWTDQSDGWLEIDELVL